MILYGKNFLIFDRLMEDINKYKHPLPYKVQTSYIPLEDETLLAADIITEKGSIIQRPTFLRMGTRWSEKENNKKFNPFIREGFNVVKIDVRGTGASLGKRILPWSRREQTDLRRIISWIQQQPWSDGHIITFGNNYASTTSELAATLNHEAIKAHIIYGNAYDLYSEFIFPGGLFLHNFCSQWSEKNIKIEKNKIKPVKDPLHNPELSEIKNQHKWNVDIYDLLSQIQFSDDTFQEKPDTNLSHISVSSYSDEISRNPAPKFVCGSWFDGKTAISTIHRYLNYSGSIICVIGPWDHHLRPIKPLLSKSSSSISSEFELYLEYLRFTKKAISNPKSIPKLLYYYTLGEEKWKVTDIWPLPDMKTTKLYLETKHQLSFNPCEYKGMKTDYQVNFKASSGKKTRWNSYFGEEIDYTKRSKQDRKLLRFTSPTFDNAIEITGHPILTLYLSSSHEDGAIFVYLEAMKRRKVYYLSEGQLRLCHWKSSASAPYCTPIPYRSFQKSKAEPLKPNLIYDIKIPLEPISVKLPTNTKIRITIGGADLDNFKLYPDNQTPPPHWNIYHNSEYGSYLQLPIKEIPLKEATG